MGNRKLPEQRPRLNVVLLGKTGSGKSASGNTILRQKIFKSSFCAGATTTDIAKGNATIDAISLTVYDTPGLFDTERSNEEILTQWESDLTLEESVPTAYLLVIRPGRFTEEESNTVQQVEEFLGERRVKNTWILFTRGDELAREEIAIEDFITDTKGIKNAVERFEGRCHVFNNKEENPDQVTKLISKIIETHSGLDPVTPPPPPPPKTSTLPERRLVLLGKTGMGKSAAGNTILGGNRFDSERCASSVTKQSQVEEAVVAGRLVSVVDTPGLFDPDLTGEEVVLELGRAIYECSPGPHALLITLPLTARFTEQEQQVIDVIRAFFGEDALKYAVILFTYGDQLEGKTVEKHIEQNKNLSALVKQCGGRYHVLNNKDRRKRRQVTELLEKIDLMIDQNGGSYYSNEMLEDAARCRTEKAEQEQREQEEREHREEEQRREEIKSAERETEERIKKENEEERKKDQEEIERLKRELTAVQSQTRRATASEAEEEMSNRADGQNSISANGQAAHENEGRGGNGPSRPSESGLMAMQSQTTAKRSDRADTQNSRAASGGDGGGGPSETGFLAFMKTHWEALVAAALAGGLVGVGVGTWVGGGVGAAVGAVFGAVVGFGVGVGLEAVILAKKKACKDKAD